MREQKYITLAHGNGGQENADLIHEIFYKIFANDILTKAEDAAVIEENRLAISTDSFTVTPLFFSGGDIGKLSVCGTCNDLAMMGAKPKYLTCAVMIEEGFDKATLKEIILSMQKELLINKACIVSGDTKVLPKGSIDKIFINTTGIGEIQQNGISASAIKKGDTIIVSNSIGKHGAAIFANREGIDIETTLKSDCASLWPVVERLLMEGVKPKALRDATRGGIASVLNEWAVQSDICIEVQEDSIPVCNEVEGICELLGFEAYNLANEGTFLIAVASEDAPKVLGILQEFEICKEASLIAEVSDRYRQKVILHSSFGTSRFLEMPNGELLPRIC